MQHEVDSDDVERRLSEIIAQASSSQVSADTIDATDLLGDVGIDSLAFMEVVVCIEEEFGITVANEDLVEERFDTVDSLKNYILTKTSNLIEGVSILHS